jgi:hypothetical protein
MTVPVAAVVVEGVVVEGVVVAAPPRVVAVDPAGAVVVGLVVDVTEADEDVDVLSSPQPTSKTEPLKTSAANET